MSGAVISSTANIGSITSSIISGSDLNVKFIRLPSSSNATQQDASLYFGGPGSSPTSNVGFIYGDGSGGDKDLVFGINDSEIIQINETKGVLINSNVTASVSGGGNISASGAIIGGSFTSSNGVLITSSLTGLGSSSPFLIKIDDTPVFSVSSSGAVVYGNLTTLPTPVTGGLVYSASNFYMGLE